MTDHLATTSSEALGQSEAFLAFSESLSLAAKVNRPVLIVGERGTGKELAAHRLHFLSPRWQEPFLALNCAALTPTLIEAELFGHEAGAFTGAAGRKIGRFEAAHKGTLFLDEIGNAPLTVQEKILRAVEYGTFERVGGVKPVRVDTRMVAATNANLPAMADDGRFKPDLLDRLSFEVLVAPPLRQRGRDVLLLANHFAARMAAELGREQIPQFSPEAQQALLAHPWPGNVRELKNVVERAVYKSPRPELNGFTFDPFAGAFPPPPAAPAAPAAPGKAAQTAPAPGVTTAGLPLDLKEELLQREREMLRRALLQSRFNQAEAANLLSLTYNQLRGLIRKHGGVRFFGG